MLLWIILIIIICVIIERIIICSKKSYMIIPGKINKLNINGKYIYLINSKDFPNMKQFPEYVEIDGLKFDGKIHNLPQHISEKLKSMNLDTSQPFNSLISGWNCYMNVSMGNDLFGDYKYISPTKIKGISICNGRLYFNTLH